MFQSKSTKAIIRGAAATLCVLGLSGCSQFGDYVRDVMRELTGGAGDPSDDDVSKLYRCDEKDIARFTREIEAHPQTAHLYRKRGVAYRWLGQYDKALLDMNKAIELDRSKQHADWFYDRGEINSLLNDWQAAVKDFSSAIALRSDNADYYRNRSEAYSSLKDYKNALNDLDTAIKLDGDSGSNLSYRAEFFLARGQLDKALDDYKKMEASDYYTGEGYEGSANIHLMQGKFDVALQDLNHWIQSSSNSEEAYRMRALVHQALKEKTKAREDNLQVVKMLSDDIFDDPEDTWRFESRARAFDSLNEKDKAKSDRLQVIKLLGYELADKKENYISTLSRRMKLYRLLGMNKEADADSDSMSRLLAEKIAKEPKKADNYHQRALAETSIALKLQDFNKALALEPNDVDYIYHVASLLFLEKKLDEAKSVCLRGLKIDYQDERLLNTLARIALEEKNYQDATKYATEAILQSPTDGQAYAIRMLALTMSGQKEKAEIDRICNEIHRHDDEEE